MLLKYGNIFCICSYVIFSRPQEVKFSASKEFDENILHCKLPYSAKYIVAKLTLVVQQISLLRQKGYSPETLCTQKNQ